MNYHMKSTRKMSNMSNNCKRLRIKLIRNTFKRSTNHLYGLLKKKHKKYSTQRKHLKMLALKNLYKQLVKFKWHKSKDRESIKRIYIQKSNITMIYWWMKITILWLKGWEWNKYKKQQRTLRSLRIQETNNTSILRMGKHIKFRLMQMENRELFKLIDWLNLFFYY